MSCTHVRTSWMKMATIMFMFCAILTVWGSSSFFHYPAMAYDRRKPFQALNYSHLWLLPATTQRSYRTRYSFGWILMHLLLNKHFNSYWLEYLVVIDFFSLYNNYFCSIIIFDFHHFIFITYSFVNCFVKF